MEVFQYDNYYKETRKEFRDDFLENILDIDLLYPLIANAAAFEGIKEDGLDAWIGYQNPFDVQSITSLFKAAYKKNLDDHESIEIQNLGKKAFNEMLKRGLNKEQIRLMLLKEEKAWTTELANEAKKKPNERDIMVIEGGKEKLKEIHAFARDLERSKSPYDNLFDISSQIAELKRLNNEINKKQNANDQDFRTYDSNEERIYELEQKLAKDMAAFNPLVVEDAINDKIASAELELEIDQIKKGKEVSKEVGRAMPKEIIDLKNDLWAVRYQVKNDIKLFEQNKDKDYTA